MRWVLAVVMTLAPWTIAAQACAPSATGTRLESDRYSVGLRTAPDPVAVGKHFALALSVCPKGGGRAPESVRVDALMPEHRHGMNYAPKVVAAPDGQYRAEGLMFHMPGRWEIVLEVRSEGRTDRLVQSLLIE